MFFFPLQAHLEGLFDNVKTVEFHEKNYDSILAIGSREKEKIELITPVMAQVSLKSTVCHHGWKKCKISLEYDPKLRQKHEFFTIFQHFW